MDVSFELTSDPSTEQSDFIYEALRQFNLQHTENDNHVLLRIFARNDKGELVGGLLGGTYWGAMHIDILWLHEDYRHMGLGRQMMAQAEAEAIRRGCRHAHVDTIDFQAPDFYLKLGYTVWGVLEDIPPGHRRIFLKKDLFLSENQ